MKRKIKSKKIISFAKVHKRWFEKMVSLVLSFILLFSMLSAGATQNRYDNFNKNYTLTGNGADDIVNVASAQLGKTGSQLGYSEQWCADFVSDCAILANQSEAIPSAGYCPTLRQYIVNAGGYYVDRYNAKAGDIVFYGNNGADHVEIVYAASGGNISTYGGNSGSAGNLYARSVRQHITQTQTIAYIVRPNYKNVNPEPTKYLDLGNDFYAYIIHTASWKQLTNDGDHHAYFSETKDEVKKIWHFIRKNNGSYRILSQFDNNALDVDLGKSENGTDVGVWTDSGTSNQEWFIYGSAGQLYLKPACSDRVLDLCGGKYYEGVNAQIWEKNNTDAQLFAIWTLDSNFIPVNVGPELFSYIINTASWRKLVNDGNHNAFFSDSLDEINTIWHLVRNENGSYKIISQYDKNVLDVYSGKDENGADVGVYEDSNARSQQWYIYGTSGQYYFRPLCSSGILDLTGGRYFDGVNAQVWEKNNTDAQLFQIWTLEKAGKSTLTIEDDSEDLVLKWTESTNTNKYTLKIWPYGSSDGDYIINEDITNNKYTVGLPQGKYEACVVSQNLFSSSESNIVQFEITEQPSDPQELPTEPTEPETIPECPYYILGDVDNNHEISIADAIMTQKHIVGIINLTGSYFKTADVDYNGEITIADAILIQKHIVGIAQIDNLTWM